MQRISIRQRGITRLHTDVIVNAANEGLWQGGGVCGAIFEAAGPEELEAACSRYGSCETGNAVITPGFKLCRYIVHAVGPVWQDGHSREPQLLYSCYRCSLDLARENNCYSIGFPLISAGIFNYPKDKAWRKALQAVNDWMKDNPDYAVDVQFAIPSEEIYKLGIQTAEELGIRLETESPRPAEQTSESNHLSEAHAFAVKYRNRYLDPDTELPALEEGFADACRALGFEMDNGTAFMTKYSEAAFAKTDALLQILDTVDDYRLLGSAIYSRYRYITHWSQEDLLKEKNRTWFIAALFRLSEITK